MRIMFVLSRARSKCFVHHCRGSPLVVTDRKLISQPAEHLTARPTYGVVVVAVPEVVVLAVVPVVVLVEAVVVAVVVTGINAEICL